MKGLFFQRKEERDAYLRARTTDDGALLTISGEGPIDPVERRLTKEEVVALRDWLDVLVRHWGL